MKKFILIIGFILYTSSLWASPPSSSFTYNSGSVISPEEVQTNESNIYRYLQTGVDTLADNAVTTGKILDGTITNSDISGSAGITYGKLSLAGGILNADISSSAAIDISKITGAGDMLYADTRHVVISATRDISSAGTQLITGAGFKPTKITLLGAINATARICTTGSWVASAGASIYWDGNAVYYMGSNLGEYWSSAGNGAAVVLTSFDSGGVTLTWSAAQGSPVGTANLVIILDR